MPTPQDPEGCDDEAAYTLDECGGACPTQATGTTADGKPFYFRFRHGAWTLETFDGALYDWHTAAYVAGGRDNRQADGYMSRAEVEAILDAHLT